jgi:RHS repeat-associated protein
METGSGANARRYYLHANHLYSIAALSDATGAVVERYQYDAMGQRTILAANGITVLTASAYGNQIGFTGRYHDDETGLQYFRSRMYSASLGRFISRDSAGYVNGMGLYGAYFVPNTTDPSGQFAGFALAEIVTAGIISTAAALAANAIMVAATATTAAVITGGGSCALMHAYIKITEDAANTASLALTMSDIVQSADTYNAAADALGNFAFALSLLRVAPWCPNFGVDPTKELIASEKATSLRLLANSSQKTCSAIKKAPLTPYTKPGGGHHVLAKSAFKGASGYNLNTALAISNQVMEKLGINHEAISVSQRLLYNAFEKTGAPLTWDAIEIIETQALSQGAKGGKLSLEAVSATVQAAIADLKAQGVPGPTRIPWSK